MSHNSGKPILEHNIFLRKEKNESLGDMKKIEIASTSDPEVSKIDMEESGTLVSELKSVLEQIKEDKTFLESSDFILNSNKEESNEKISPENQFYNVIMQKQKQENEGTVNPTSHRNFLRKPFANVDMKEKELEEKETEDKLTCKMEQIIDTVKNFDSLTKEETERPLFSLSREEAILHIYKPHEERKQITISDKEMNNEFICSNKQELSSNQLKELRQAIESYQRQQMSKDPFCVFPELLRNKNQENENETEDKDKNKEDEEDEFEDVNEFEDEEEDDEFEYRFIGVDDDDDEEEDEAEGKEEHEKEFDQYESESDEDDFVQFYCTEDEFVYNGKVYKYAKQNHIDKNDNSNQQTSNKFGYPIPKKPTAEEEDDMNKFHDVIKKMQYITIGPFKAHKYVLSNLKAPRYDKYNSSPITFRNSYGQVDLLEALSEDPYDEDDPLYRVPNYYSPSLETISELPEESQNEKVTENEHENKNFTMNQSQQTIQTINEPALLNHRETIPTKVCHRGRVLLESSDAFDDLMDIEKTPSEFPDSTIIRNLNNSNKNASIKKNSTVETNIDLPDNIKDDEKYWNENSNVNQNQNNLNEKPIKYVSKNDSHNNNNNFSSEKSYMWNTMFSPKLDQIKPLFHIPLLEIVEPNSTYISPILFQIITPIICIFILLLTIIFIKPFKKLSKI